MFEKGIYGFLFVDFLIIVCCFFQLANMFGRFQWLTCPRKVIYLGKVSPNWLGRLAAQFLKA